MTEQRPEDENVTAEWESQKSTTPRKGGGTYGHLPGSDPEGGGWRLVCLAKDCNEPPKLVRYLPDDDSPIWDCPSCGGSRTAEWLPSDSGTER
jgi:hypothetical protein